MIWASGAGFPATTLSNPNKVRDWRIYADFAQSLIQVARPLYGRKGLSSGSGQHCICTGFINNRPVPVSLSLGAVPFNQIRRQLHTLLDLRGNIPTFIHISNEKLHDVNVLDILVPEAREFYVMDRGYLDFARLFQMNNAGAFFVTRTKSNTQFCRRYSHRVDKSTGVKCDQTIALTGNRSKTDYPQPLRRVKYHDPENEKTYDFLTNNVVIPARTVADLYCFRWRVELFFKWIKQHLRIKSFYGTSENAVKTQVWIAISVYVLVAIIKKRLNIQLSLYTILQILSVTLFEKLPLDHLLINHDSSLTHLESSIQLNLFD